MYKNCQHEVDILKLIKKGGLDHFCNEPESTIDGPMKESSPKRITRFLKAQDLANKFVSMHKETKLDRDSYSKLLMA